MNDAARMGIFDGPRNLPYQRDARIERGFGACAMRINALAVDDFKREPRSSVCLNASIENIRDIRVLQACENVSLHQDAVVPAARIAYEIRELERNTAL